MSNSFKSLKVALINMAAILMMLAKLATLVLLNIKVFWNKRYGVRISANGAINKFLSHDSNYALNVVM